MQLPRKRLITIRLRPQLSLRRNLHIIRQHHNSYCNFPAICHKLQRLTSTEPLHAQDFANVVFGDADAVDLLYQILRLQPCVVGGRAGTNSQKSAPYKSDLYKITVELTIEDFYLRITRATRVPSNIRPRLCPLGFDCEEDSVEAPAPAEFLL